MSSLYQLCVMVFEWYVFRKLLIKAENALYQARHADCSPTVCSPTLEVVTHVEMKCLGLSTHPPTSALLLLSGDSVALFAKCKTRF